MSLKRQPVIKRNETHIYQIRLESHLGPQWAAWFEGMSVSLESDGDTLLTGRVEDQAALYGLLKKARDIGLPLVSVNRLDPEEENRTS